ncbi:MAG: peroxiredoxin family protein [Thiohalomonadales bacterium]
MSRHPLLKLNMKSKTWKIILPTLVLLLVSFPVLSGTLSDFSGKQKSISDYSGNGKWLVVMLWASDCHVCNQEAGAYVKFHQQHADKDAQILGVSLDGKAKFSDAEKFIKRHKLNFPNLIGEPETVASIYTELTGEQWIGTPTFLVYNPKGELLGAQVGAVPTEVIEGFIERESSNSTP